MKNKIKTSAVRWRISSKLVFASCMGYFDRAYCSYEFCVTSSRMLVKYIRIIYNGYSCKGYAFSSPGE